MPKYEEVSFLSSLFDCQSDPAYCVMPYVDLISCLLQQLASEAHSHYTTGSRLIYGLVDEGTDAAAQKLLLYCKYQTALEDLRLFRCHSQ
jgi:hypothetical protein